MANYQSATGKLLSVASQNTININGSQGVLSSPWQNLTTASLSLDDLDFTQPHIKKYQVIEIEEDLLALSCAWQRIRNTRMVDPEGPYIPVSRLTDQVLFKHLTQADHDKAADIRDYYSKKIMLWKLKDQKLSKFREDMNSFIHTNGKIFREDMMPLAYRMPEFYDYDTEFDSLSNDYNKKVTQNIHQLPDIKSLKLAKTFNVGKRYNKRKEYWFSDANNDLVTISLDQNNPLISLLDMHTTNYIKIEGIYVKRNRDNNEYLEVNKYKFV